MAAEPSMKTFGVTSVAHVGRLRLSLEVSDIYAYGRDREDQPGQSANQGHEELSQVLVRGLLVWYEGLGVDGNLLDLGNVVLLVRPDLMGLGILFVDDPDSLKHSPFDIEGGEFPVKAGKELLDERLLARAFEIVDMRAEDQHEYLSRGVPGTGK